MPWGSHDYWILLTIVVVLRGSLSQTLERRNSRVAGTLLGCVLAVALLSAHPTPLALLVAHDGGAGHRARLRGAALPRSPPWRRQCSAWCRRTCSTSA